jgi:hypothetical protein
MPANSQNPLIISVKKIINPASCHWWVHFDPALVDRFISIAQPLYDLFSGKDDNVPREELEGMIVEYFTKISVAY